MELKAFDRKNESDLTVFSGMYRTYLRELSVFNGEDPWITDAEIKKMLRAENHSFLLAWEGKSPAGFVAISFGQNTHPMTKFFVRDFFVQPSMRRRGLGLAMVRELIQQRSGSFCMYVLKKNIPAKDFWRSAIGEIGYVDQSYIFSQSLAPDNCEFWFAAPRELR